MSYQNECVCPNCGAHNTIRLRRIEAGLGAGDVEIEQRVCEDCGAAPAYPDIYPLVVCGDCGRLCCQTDSRCIERHAAHDEHAAQYGCPPPRRR